MTPVVPSQAGPRQDTAAAPVAAGTAPGASHDPPQATRPAGTPARRRELEELRRLYEHAPCGYLVTDDEGTITRVNATFASWTGYSREELVGLKVHALMPVGDRILYTTSLMPQLRMAGAVPEVMVEFVSADRQRQPVLLSATRLPPVAAAPAEVAVVVFAAHERRRYERQLVDALRRAQDSERSRAAAEEAMRALALRDSLTGLPNRAGLSEYLQQALDEREVPGSPGVGLLFVDLDHFKAVNDSLGHAAGDELLTVVAQRLTSAVRAGAVVARWSGDEFVVVDDLQDDHAAASTAHRLLQALAAPVVIEDLEIVVSASIGAARAGEQETVARLVHHADVAMYRAKARGRNCVEIHDPDHLDPAVDRLRLLGQLRSGIERGELRVHYQPRMDLRRGRLAGVEALVRWQHPTRGLLSPADFIPVAEESGLVRRLGAWVLDQAVAQGAQWARESADGSPVEIAVNISTRQLGDPDLAHLVAAALTAHHFDPALLTLEVTETALINDPDAALETLRALKDLGVSLAVDDFGTGYASFVHLRRFPLDELKIDRSFVAGMADNRGDAAIVATCVELAHSLGIRAVAEGVETSDQEQALVDLDCDQAQGYHYTHALPADELDPWIHHTRS